MCNTSPEINELATALSKAQGEMDAAEKASLNPHFGKKYASLAAVRDAVRGPLAKNGLAVAQTLSNCEKGVRITTTLMHASGQWMRDALEVPMTKFDAQGLGSSATYGLRYSLQAITGIAPDDASDDDANHASSRQEQSSEMLDDRRPVKTPAKAASKPKPDPTKVDESKFSAALANATDLDGIKKVLANLDAKPLSALEKQPLYYITFTKVLTLRLEREEALWARNLICEKKVAAMLSEADYVTLIGIVDQMLDRMVEPAIA